MTQKQKRLAFLRNLADPAQQGLTEAVAIARADMGAGNSIDEELVELLHDEVESKTGAECTCRILEIVSALGCAPRILSLKLALVGHKDAQVRAKSVLLIGRELKSPDWTMRRMLDPDPVVQANAIESIWGVQSPEMHRILERAARSRNHRVAANGLVGLYILNDVSCIPRLFEMAEHSEELFRQSALWAMGETRDARFLPYLVETYKRASSGSKAILFGAMSRIRKHLNCAQEAGSFRLRAAGWRALTNGSRAFRLSVTQCADQTPPLFTNMNLVLQDEAGLVTNYCITPQPNPPLIVALFAIPRTLSQDCVYRQAVEEGLTAAVKTKRACDLWWIHRYGTNETAQQSILSIPAEDRALNNHRRAHQNLLSDEAFINRFIPGPGRLDESSQDIASGIRRVLEIAGRTAGSRHVFVCFDRDCPLEERDLKRLAEAASDSDTRLHGILPSPDSDSFSGIRQLCESSGGTFACVEVGRIAELIAANYEQLLNRYEVTYESSSSANIPQVRIISQHGCAEWKENRV